MAFRSAASSRIHIGHLAAAAYARTADIDSPTDMIDVTTWADTARQFIPTLTDGGTFSISGPLDVDASANGQFDILGDLRSVSTEIPITYQPVGSDGGAWLAGAWETNLSTSSGVAQSVDWTLAAQISGQVDFAGRVLSEATITTDTNGSSLDNGAATSNGAVFHLHVTAFSGLTSDGITVQGSTTGAFSGEQTTITTFTSVTAIGSERKAVTGTIPRYLRVVDDVTGTGSVSRLVAVSRR